MPLIILRRNAPPPGNSDDPSPASSSPFSSPPPHPPLSPSPFPPFPQKRNKMKTAFACIARAERETPPTKNKTGSLNTKGPRNAIGEGRIGAKSESRSRRTPAGGVLSPSPPPFSPPIYLCIYLPPSLSRTIVSARPRRANRCPFPSIFAKEPDPPRVHCSVSLFLHRRR